MWTPTADFSYGVGAGLGVWFLFEVLKIIRECCVNKPAATAPPMKPFIRDNPISYESDNYPAPPRRRMPIPPIIPNAPEQPGMYSPTSL